MAIWRFQCNIIPARLNFDRLSHDEMISWKGIPQPPHNLKFLEQEDSWSKDIIQYGKSDETCIEFIYIDNILDEISCRLDLRSLTKTNLISVIEYVQEIGAMFLVGDKIYSPRMEEIIGVMKKSRANRFCKNPVEYILSQNEKLEISKKLNEISELKKSLERDNTKLNEQEHEIINNAKIQARNILLDAKEEANEIISKMNDVSKSNSDLNNLRNKLNKDIKDISATSLSNNVAKESKSAISVEDAKPNTEVFVTTLGQNGIIVSNVSKSNEVQVQVGSMKLSVNLKYLEKIVNTNKNNKSTSSYSSVSKAKNVSSEINVIGLNVEEAVFVVDKFLDDCSIANLQTVRIVHGKGTGKLREGIHKFLKSNSRVKSFRIGTYGEGEMGVR